MTKAMWNNIKKLHNDEQGADMVEYILIVAAIALPLMGVAWYFGKDIAKKASEWWDAIKGGSGQTAAPDNDPHNF